MLIENATVIFTGMAGPAMCATNGEGSSLGQCRLRFRRRDPDSREHREQTDHEVRRDRLTDEDGRFTAETLFGEASDANLEKVKRGNGMIVNFPRGKGEVFHAGSCEWVAGLLRQDPMVERVTRNVLDRYLGKS